MDRTIGIIVVASVITLLAAIIIPSLVSTLGTTGETSNNLQERGSCQFQTDRAEKSNQPDMVEDRCLDYIDDPTFKTKAETTEVSCILTGSC